MLTNMKRYLKNAIIFCLILIILKVCISLFLRFYYFPYHGTDRHTYETAFPMVLGGGETKEIQYMPVPGGCFEVCSGREESRGCVVNEYSRTCTFRCYGYLHNTCGSRVDFLKFLLFL